MSEYMTQENRFDFEKVLMLLNPGVAMHDALEELERCYEKIDKMDEAILSARELLMSYFDAETLSDDEEAAQEILDVVKELRKASE